MQIPTPPESVVLTRQSKIYFEGKVSSTYLVKLVVLTFLAGPSCVKRFIHLNRKVHMFWLKGSYVLVERFIRLD